MAVAITDTELPTRRPRWSPDTSAIVYSQRTEDAQRLMLIGDGLAVRDLAQRAPHLELERRAAQVQGQGEAAPLALQVLADLARRHAIRRETPLNARPREVATQEAREAAAARVGQRHVGEARLGGGQPQGPDR